MKRFEMRVDPLTQEIFYAVPSKGYHLMQDPLLNKGSCFPKEERAEFDLIGLLADRAGTLQEQLDRALANFQMKNTDLERYITLMGLLDRNETLFYALLKDHLEELLPIIYTPTVGLACLKLSHIIRRYRGVYLTPQNVGSTERALRNVGLPDISLIVVTDGERILGYGDLGVDGMGIPIGKVALYVAAGGIHPASTLPVCLDVGTNNERLLNDPLYIGIRKPRLTGEHYWEVVERFVQGVKRTFPRALIQWEDFGKDNAFTLLDRYQGRIPSFDDDIQGTGSVAVAVLKSATKVTGRPISAEKIAILGFGQAGSGVANAITTMMVEEEKIPVAEARRRIYAIDLPGLLMEGEDVEPQQQRFLQPREIIQSWPIDHTRPPTLSEVVEHAGITVVIGVAAKPGAFDEALLHQLGKNAERPIILSLSNPTSRSETTPEAVAKVLGKRALMAFGSPFSSVKYDDGTTLVPSQCNNLYIFPGMGLGAIVCQASRVTSRMFHAASVALSNLVTTEELQRGLLLPSLKNIRSVSEAVALAVAMQAREDSIGMQVSDERLRYLIQDAMWIPRYYPYRYQTYIE
jgi:malate dehydrogenase (oxaloacetate-decarboxylating)